MRFHARRTRSRRGWTCRRRRRSPVAITEESTKCSRAPVHGLERRTGRRWADEQLSLGQLIEPGADVDRWAAIGPYLGDRFAMVGHDHGVAFSYTAEDRREPRLGLVYRVRIAHSLS